MKLFHNFTRHLLITHTNHSVCWTKDLLYWPCYLRVFIDIFSDDRQVFNSFSLSTEVKSLPSQDITSSILIKVIWQNAWFAALNLLVIRHFGTCFRVSNFDPLIQVCFFSAKEWKCQLIVIIKTFVFHHRALWELISSSQCFTAQVVVAMFKKNWFMFLAVHISSYGCTWEVWEHSRS